MPRPQKFRLGDLLVQEGLITAEQLDQALQEQRSSGRKLGRVLSDQGLVTEAQIAKAVARQLHAPFIDLAHYPLRPELAQQLPEGHARRLRAIVLDDPPSGLMIGMADPTDIYAFDEIGRLLKRSVDLAVVTETHLLAALDRVYTSTKEIEGLARELTSELAGTESDLGDLLGMDTTSNEDAPVVRLLYSVFEQALRTRTSDIHIEPQEKQLRIRFRIDGVLHVQTEADAKIAGAVALRLKLMSGLDISEKRLPQDGRFAVRLKDGTVDVRISTLPAQYGESVVMRLLSQSAGMLELERLAMPEPMLAALRRAIDKPSGMILVTGPTGSGKTTTLYAALNALNSTERKIITVEDPVEYRLPGLNQVQVMEKIDMTFDRVLRSALRQDPDVILVGEMRDKTTAEIGLRAAMTGHLVLSTLHTNDAASTPARLIDMGVPRWMVALSLQLVAAQRLVRTLCVSCATPHDPNPHELVWLKRELGDEAEGKPLHYGRGCPECNHTGFKGRTGVYEFLEMSLPLIEALSDPEPGVFAKAARVQMAGNTLRRDAARLVMAGRTTVDEAMRVSAQVDE
ncbi:MAG TPA: GspE/PulE family protein [Aquabacterium sp.]|uniref:GspE/PulE family protein n=1 Tax=Aquabacterium sp. TaxID=1872578 RepID=UPI002E379E6E|nr:GspE/PulE family protein [Aquabacterium sp.]HEX5372610.1 GspE/PulE family protein [Aquabacterium sp.]